MRVVVAPRWRSASSPWRCKGAVTGVVAVTALVLAPAGYAFRTSAEPDPSIVLKVLLAVGLVVATMGFLQSVRSITTVDAARPARRPVPVGPGPPLRSTFRAGADPSSFDDVVHDRSRPPGPWRSPPRSWVWPWAALRCRLALAVGRAPARPVMPPCLRSGRSRGPRPRSRASVPAAVAGIAAPGLGSAVFLAMPRLPASLVRTPPFTLGHRTPTSSLDRRRDTNPGLPRAPAETGVPWTSPRSGIRPAPRWTSGRVGRCRTSIVYSASGRTSPSLACGGLDNH